ncbi:hypothetical protein ACP2AV_05650 [Aliiroseovarius sp. PTFE2010]|uniref:hypothetical protein n=1 Tax=Aliiroseovarius sp. PTFE2010 TaxID=3417190 RepID=UPI003CFB8240
MKYVLTALTLAAATLSTPAAAANQCAKRDQVVTRLETKYGETRQSIGLGANNGVVEVFASPDTGTWTITVTMPSGVTCLVASGQAFETLAEATVIPGSDT